jgi:hypothetical protein
MVAPLGYMATVRVVAAKATGIWIANMRARKMMVEMRTGKSRPMKEYPPDFTGYAPRTSIGALFW